MSQLHSFSSLPVKASSKYGKKASEKVEKVMKELKASTLKSGSSGKKVYQPQTGDRDRTVRSATRGRQGAAAERSLFEEIGHRQEDRNEKIARQAIRRAKYPVGSPARNSFPQAMLLRRTSASYRQRTRAFPFDLIIDIGDIHG